ncbi:MAG TPA: hypothetical protein VIZ17_13490 [Acetobacteraceae bacterium]
MKLPIALAGIAGLLLLVGCSSRPPQTAGEVACRQQAYTDPHVKALIAASNPSTTNNIFDFRFTTPQDDAQAAIRQATLDCMRRRGLISAGGVEPVKQYPFGGLGF